MHICNDSSMRMYVWHDFITFVVRVNTSDVTHSCACMWDMSNLACIWDMDVANCMTFLTHVQESYYTCIWDMSNLACIWDMDAANRMTFLTF